MLTLHATYPSRQSPYLESVDEDRQELDGQYEQRVDDRQDEANGRKFTCFCGEEDGEVDEANKASKRDKEGDAWSKTV